MGREALHLREGRSPLAPPSLISTGGNTKLRAEINRNQIFLELGPGHGADALQSSHSLICVYFTALRNVLGRLWPSLCVYAHCCCSCTCALLNTEGFFKCVGSVVLTQTWLYHFL